MEHDKDNQGKPYSNILPGVVAAFLGAVAVIACDRPSTRAQSEDATRKAAAEDFARNASPVPRDPAKGGMAAAPAAGSAAQASARPSPMPPPEAVTDTVITARITTALKSDPEMAGADVTVNTDRGVVSLAGTVKSYEQVGVASAHAQRQDGVVRVDNELSVQVG